MDFEHLDQQSPIYDRKDSKDLLPEKKEFNLLRPDFKEHLLNWSKNGYAILPKFFNEARVDEIIAEVARLKSAGKAKTRVDDRIMFAFLQSKPIYKAGADVELTGILKLLLDQEVDLFQSINFETGSGQHSHSDSIHMSTYPVGNMIAVWVALEDIGESQGPLHYYPGSHKLPYFMNDAFGNSGNKWMLGNKGYSQYEKEIDRLIQEKSFEKKVFLAKKGDVLIWHANLIHGGEPVQDQQSTRKSMVFHYYSKNAVCFHEITQRPSFKKPIPDSFKA